jgi:hypothetical protein
VESFEQEGIEQRACDQAIGETLAVAAKIRVRTGAVVGHVVGR